MGGHPNSKKSGDGGVDGEMKIHLGTDKDGNDKWGKVVFSVKTGKQKAPAMIRELKGTVKDFDAVMGVLILDADPTEKMEEAAVKAGSFKYSFRDDMPPNFYDKIQIITSGEIIDGNSISTPPTLAAIKLHRENAQGRLLG